MRAFHKEKLFWVICSLFVILTAISVLFVKGSGDNCPRRERESKVLSRLSSAFVEYIHQETPGTTVGFSNYLAMQTWTADDLKIYHSWHASIEVDSNSNRTLNIHYPSDSNFTCINEAGIVLLKRTRRVRPSSRQAEPMKGE